MSVDLAEGGPYSGADVSRSVQIPVTPGESGRAVSDPPRCFWRVRLKERWTSWQHSITELSGNARVDQGVLVHWPVPGRVWAGEEHSHASVEGELGVCGQLFASTPRQGPSEVKTYVSRILTKLDVLDRVQAVVLAHRAGLATWSDSQRRAHDLGVTCPADRRSPRLQRPPREGSRVSAAAGFAVRERSVTSCSHPRTNWKREQI